jgi:hypothetical protein
MRTRIKNSFNRFGLTFLVLVAAFFLVVGCTAPKAAPDPLAGWRCFSHNPNTLDKAIRDDYQDFIQKLPPNERGYYVGDVSFFEDVTGQHAVSIEIFSNKVTASFHYALIYDKENKRIQVIKYGYSKYQS